MTTQERLEALERGLSAAKRRNKYLLIGLVLLAVAWAFTSIAGIVQTRARDKIIRAEGLELVDSRGNVRITLGMTEFGPALRLFDENGRFRASLIVSDNGPALALCDENETPRAGLTVTEFGPGLCLYDKNGKGCADLKVSDDGPMLDLFDENGTFRAGLGASVLVLADEKGCPVWFAP